MYTKKQHIIRKSLIITGSIILGGIVSIVGAATYDASIQDRANKMVDSIKANANALNPVDRPVYYSLVRKNIQSLIAVLMEVDTRLKPLSDESLFTPVNEILTVNIIGSPNGAVFCGDNTRTDYMTYPYSNGTTRFYKSPCVTERGGKIWAKCVNNSGTNIISVGKSDTITLTCLATATASCGGTEPTSGAGMIKRISGAAGIQDTQWSYIDNIAGYTADDFGSTACKWTCKPGYTRSGNGCVSKTMEVDTRLKPLSDESLFTPVNEILTVNIIGSPNGAVFCGDNTRTDYMTYPYSNGTTRFYKSPCVTERGGKIWAKCVNNSGTNIISVGKSDTITLTCLATATASCGGTEPTSGAGMIKRISGAAGIQDTQWSYIDNIAGYTADDFGSTACKWTCKPGYTRSGNGCVSKTMEVDTRLKPLSDESLFTPVNEILTVNIIGSPNGAVFCGDNTRTDYMTYPYSNGTTRFYKSPCVTERGGKIWAKCVNNSGTNIISVGKSDTITLTCLATATASCGGTEPTSGAGMIKRISGAAGIQDAQWSYIDNIAGYTADDFGSTACKWTCKPGYTRSGNGCVSKTIGGQSCRWQDHAVFGPVGPLDIDITKIACTTSNSGVSSYEISGSRQKVATCLCDGVSTSSNTSNSNSSSNGGAVFGGTSPKSSNSVTQSSDPFVIGGTSPKSSNSVTQSSDPFVIGGTSTNTNITSNSSTSSNGGAAFGGSATVVNNPKTYYTASNYTDAKTTFFAGETVYAYISGGDVNNTWGCVDIPGTDNCPNGIGWRKLTIPYNGTNPDEWQYNATRKRIELTGLYIYSTYPIGVYKGYVRNGTGGTPVMSTFSVTSPYEMSCGVTFGPINVPPVSQCQYDGQLFTVDGAPDGCKCIKK